MLAAFFDWLRERFGLAGDRLQQAWAWLCTVNARVRWALIVDATVTVIAIFLVWATESNTPARLAFIPVLICWLYIARLVAVNVWLAELGVTLADRGVSTLETWWDGVRSRMPRWITIFIGKPGGEVPPRPIASVTGASQARREADPIWHDASVGGHIFHILTTIWMWAHVLLYASAWLPTWLIMGELIAITAMILFFVGTEDFVNIKRWRKVLGWVVGVHATLRIGLLVMHLFVPGTYQYVQTNLNYFDDGKATQAEAIEEDKKDDMARITALRTESRGLKKRYQAHLDARHTGYDRDWTEQDAQYWKSVKTQIADMEAIQVAEASGESQGSWFARYPVFFGVLLLAGAFLALNELGAFKTSSAASH